MPPVVKGTMKPWNISIDLNINDIPLSVPTYLQTLLKRKCNITVTMYSHMQIGTKW